MTELYERVGRRFAEGGMGSVNAELISEIEALKGEVRLLRGEVLALNALVEARTTPALSAKSRRSRPKR